MPVTYIQENPVLSFIGLIAIIAIIWWIVKQNQSTTTTATNGVTNATRVSNLNY